MKKVILSLVSVLIMLSLSVCASASEADVSSEPQSNILIVYFSVMENDGVDTIGSASRVATNDELLGNNQYIAQLIRQETGGDLFSIETTQTYPTTHEALLEFAQNEIGTRPELSVQPENLDDYDVIFLGYPIWNADLPMPLYTFLETCDLSGKTIVPFTVHGRSGFAGTIRTIAALQPDANVVEDGLSVSRNNVLDAQDAVREWISGLQIQE